MKILFFLCFAAVAGRLNTVKFHLVKEFLEKTNARACFLIVCWQKFEVVKMEKFIRSNLSIRIAYLPVKENITLTIKDEQFEKVSYILDLSCEQTHKVLEEISLVGKFRFTYSWLMIHNNNIGKEDIRYLFRGLKLRADMDVTVVVPRNHQYYEIFDICKPGLGVDTVIKKVAEFTNLKFSSSYRSSTFYESRNNLSGVLIRNGNTVNYSFEVEADYAQAIRTKEIGPFLKFNFQLFLILKQIHNFHFNTTLAEAWFGNSSSGIDSALSSLLYKDEIDIMSSGGILRYGRMDYYDFLLPHFQFRNPGTVNPGAGVLKPFSIETWYATIGAGALIGTAIKFAYWIENHYLNAKAKYSFFTAMVITISVFAQQGSASLPNYLGGRIIFLNLLITSILLYNYYTSSLVSSLLSTKPYVMTTIKELYESNLKVAIENQPYTITYIVQQSEDEYIQKLNSTKIYSAGEPNFLSPQEGVAMIKRGGFAYHTSTGSAYPMIAKSFEQNLICDLAEIDFVRPGILGLPVQKRSQYTELFQISLMKMRVSGIFEREYNIWSSKKPECLLNSRVVSVGNNELFLVYLILLIGVFLSASVLIIEIAAFRFSNRDKNMIFLH